MMVWKGEVNGAPILWDFNFILYGDSLEGLLELLGEGAWREGREVKNLCYLCRGPVFWSQHPHWVTHKSLQLQLRGSNILV